MTITIITSEKKCTYYSRNFDLIQKYFKPGVWLSRSIEILNFDRARPYPTAESHIKLMIILDHKQRQRKRSRVRNYVPIQKHFEVGG
jgi:hypothetical protein